MEVAVVLTACAVERVTAVNRHVVNTAIAFKNFFDS